MDAEAGMGNAELVNRRRSSDGDDAKGAGTEQTEQRALVMRGQSVDNTSQTLVEQAVQPFFNNQNTILMAARSDKGELMLLHETRIFYFKRSGGVVFDDPVDKDRDFANQVNYLTTLLLGLLTTRKYRLLYSFYLLWHVMDTICLASLVATLFFSEGGFDSFLHIITTYVWIFAALGVELFYSVLQSTVQIWFLNRVSLYVIIALYALYMAVFFYYDAWSTLVIVLFVCRFVAFVGSVGIDYCIDMELRYDLIHLKLHSYQLMKGCLPLAIRRFLGCEIDYKENIGILYVAGDNNEIDLGNGWSFKGSLCAWSPVDAFVANVDHNNDNSTGHRFLFNFMFVITYCILGIPLFIVIGFYLVVLSLAAKCCCKKSDGTIFGEFTKRYSY